MLDPCRSAALTCAALAATVVSGCDGGGGEDVEPLVELGFGEGSAFEPLVDGAELPMVNGPQGGFWVMPRLRTTGFDAVLDVRTVVDDLVTAVTLIDSDSERMFEVKEDGWTDSLLFLHVPSVRTLDDFAAVDGHDAYLELVISDPSASLSFEANVVLEAVGQ